MEAPKEINIKVVNNKKYVSALLDEIFEAGVHGKKEMANELSISVSTLNLKISKGTGLPNYKKLGSAKNARVVFNIVDVAQYLTQTIKTV